MQWQTYIQHHPEGKYIVATSPVAINFTLPPLLSPGELVHIYPMSIDDLNQPVSATYNVIFESDALFAKTDPSISNKGPLQVFGKPGTWFNLTLEIQNARYVTATPPGVLGNCPLGFILVNSSVCICSADIPGREIASIPSCDYVNFRALLLIGYWIGCTANNTVETGVCVWCNYERPILSPLPRTCDDLEHFSMCAEHRRGWFCGECEEGFSVYFHSTTFVCGECTYGALGLLAYLASDIIPMILLFTTIMTMKMRVTSGYLQSFIFFAQIMLILNHSPVLTHTSDTTNTFIRIHSFIVGFFSLVFFHLDEMSFCLFKGAGLIDVVAFYYVTTLFSIAFLAFFIARVNCKSVQTGSIRMPCCVKILHLAGKVTSLKNPTVHGISTFFMLSYSTLTYVSLLLIHNLPVYEGGRIRYVSSLQNSFDYFGPEHLPYAIPALLVLIFLSLPPPLLLISYPLLWKIKAKLRHNAQNENDTTVWPIRKLLPLIDSFQGVFRDNCRMFAGLLFLWRFILSAIYVFHNTNFDQFYLFFVIALLIIFTVHTLARPYNKKMYNTIDGLMLANLTIITLLKWYISVPSLGEVNSNVVELLTIIMLILMYIPIIVVLVVTILWVLKRLRILPEEIKCPSTQEEEFSQREESAHSAPSKNLEVLADEDLFIRAAEINNVPMRSISSSVAGVEFEDKDICNNK